MQTAAHTHTPNSLPMSIMYTCGEARCAPERPRFWDGLSSQLSAFTLPLVGVVTFTCAATELLLDDAGSL